MTAVSPEAKTKNLVASRVRTQALAELGRRYPAEFREILDQMRTAADLPPTTPRPRRRS